MSPERQRLIRLLFDEYIEMYAARDARLVTRFSDNFSGFAGSSDQLVKSRSDWVDVTLQDFAQVPGRIGIDVVDLFPQELSNDVVAVTAFFHIRLPIPDALFARETARLVLVFRHEEGDWKIAHSSISIPYGLARDGEVYPVGRLQQRNLELEALVEERTQALAQANQRLQLISNTDGLTGIANRRHFDQTLAHEWARAQRAQTPLSLIMLDVDVFKHFNDHYGHLAGDACLRTLATTLAQVPTQTEGCIADPRTGTLYVGEEDAGIWAIDMMSGAKRMVAAIDNKLLVADVEGLAIAPEGTDGGYLVASSQGDNAYAVFRLPDVAPVGRFRIAQGAFGSVEETDGIELKGGNFGPQFPDGLFVAQDGENRPFAQNFKLVSWAEALAALAK